MRAGSRTSRNEMIKDVFREFVYVESTGLGVPRNILAAIRVHHGTEGGLIAEESRFTARLCENNLAPLPRPIT